LVIAMQRETVSPSCGCQFSSAKSGVDALRSSVIITLAAVAPLPAFPAWSVNAASATAVSAAAATDGRTALAARRILRA
jgi:hypothetical protein